ncbi:MAG: hypothetical protein KAJ52_01220 [Sedimentisphaerales bacterium]|nr:hypothetical protein [Sedimentisphaerales bacterium]
MTGPVELYDFPGYAKISPNSCTCTAEVGICGKTGLIDIGHWQNLSRGLDWK